MLLTPKQLSLQIYKREKIINYKENNNKENNTNNKENSNTNNNTNIKENNNRETNKLQWYSRNQTVKQICSNEKLIKECNFRYMY